MSRWLLEARVLVRFLGSGAVNTLLGFGIIFALMAGGMDPLWANIAGYAVGFVIGFLLSRNFVFRSNGKFIGQSLRYLLSFTICFVLNLFVLRAALQHMAAIPAQVLASAAYTASMFLLARLWIYRSPHEE
ncbi:hypothetical protein GmRootA79_38940 [Acidovorax sp. A79]|uniref:GtrA family protein n=1 Tax=Acidovorax sp. A79 TaxID=3056107 RepID=UPI0034E88D13